MTEQLGDLLSGVLVLAFMLAVPALLVRRSWPEAERPRTIPVAAPPPRAEARIHQRPSAGERVGGPGSAVLREGSGLAATLPPSAACPSRQMPRRGRRREQPDTEACLAPVGSAEDATISSLLGFRALLG